MLISIEGHSVADFDTQSAFNRWQTTTFKLKASWIQSTLYDLFLKLQVTVLSLLILTDIMIMTCLIDKLTYT
jgi:hypothetical protein